MTVNELIASQGWEAMKKYEINGWMAVDDHAIHVVNAICTSFGYLFVETDKSATSFGHIYDNVYTKLFSDHNVDCVTLCSSYDDAMMEARAYQAVIEEGQAEEAEDILSYLDAFCRAYDLCKVYDVQRKVHKIIKDEKTTRFSVLNKLLLNYCGYYSSGDEFVIDGDDQYQLQQIFRTRMIHFLNADNYDMETCINIDHVVSVNTYISVNDKDAIHLTMDNGSKFNIYKEDNGRLFKVLNILFS